MDNIAIVGMGCLYPDYVTKENFWERMMKGEAFTTKNTFNGSEIELATVPKERSKEFFTKHFSEEEYKEMDTLGEVFKWTTYLCKDALEESGYLHNKQRMQRTGLVMGVFAMPAAEYTPFFGNLNYAVGAGIQAALGRDDFKFQYNKPNPYDTKALLADTEPSNYVAEKFSLGGPILNVNTACSTPIYAMKLAIMYLQQGKADMMLAGAQCYNQLNGSLSGLFDILGILSRPGQNKPFDKNSQGVIGGSGAGMFALKRLKDAERDGDEILGVIESIGWSNDGGKKAILAPDAGGQILSYEDAYRDELSPDVDYIECHATGTVTGDWTEIDSITQYFRKKGADPLLGALKGNTGHFFTASSHAAVAKVLLAMKHNMIPQTIQIDDPLDKRIVLENTPWEQKGIVKRAAINSFGFGGANAHIVIREYDKDKEAEYVERTIRDSYAKMAIVGMGMRVGEMQSVQEYYKNMLHNKTVLKEPHMSRWLELEDPSEYLKGFNADGFVKGSYIYDFDFDFMEYKFPALGDEYFLRKDFLLLKAASEAVRDAGITKGEHPRTAVIINSGVDYSEMNFTSSLELRDQIIESIHSSWPEMTDRQIDEIMDILREKEKVRETSNSVPGLMPSIRASRVSAHWEFHGPAFSVLNKEVGLAKTLEIAQYMLAEDIVENVVVGCVELIGEPEHLYVQNLLGNLGLMGEYGISEGVVVFVLKKLEEAQEKKDHVYAVIDDVAIREPDTDVQRQMQSGITQVLQKGGINKNEIGYIEMPATASDEQKDSLERLLRGDFEKYIDHRNLVQDSVENYTGISLSLTSAIAMAKNALQLSNGIKFQDGTGTYSTWTSEDGRRAALLNSFTEEGESSHILLSGAPDQEGNPHKMHTDTMLFPIAAANKKELCTQLEQLAKAVGKKGTQALLEEMWSRFDSTSKGSSVLCLLATDKDSLQSEIKLAQEKTEQFFTDGFAWESRNGSFFTANPAGKDAKIVYMFPPGEMFQGAKYFEYLSRFPELKKYYLDLMNAGFMAKADVKGQLQEEYVMEIVEARFGVDIVRKKLQVNPDIILGASMGELACLFALDSMDHQSKYTTDVLIEELVEVLEKMFTIDATKNTYLGQNIQSWESWYAKGNKDELLQLIEDEPTVFATIIGSPEDIVISGEADACKRVLNRFSGFGTRLKDATAVHTPIVKQKYPEIGAEAFSKKLSLRKDLDYVVYNTHTLDVLDAYKEGALVESFEQVVTNMVDFNSVVEQAYEDGGRIFIDLSTSQICETWAASTLKGKDAFVASIYSQNHNPEEHLPRLLAKLISNGISFDSARYFDLFRFSISDKPKFIRTVHIGIQDYLDRVSEGSEKTWKRVTDLAPVSKAEPVETKAAESKPLQAEVKSANETAENRPVSMPPVVVQAEASQAPIGGLPHLLKKTLEDNVKAYSLYVENENAILENLLRATGGKVPDRLITPVAAVPVQSPAAPPPVQKQEKECLWNLEQIIEMSSTSMANVLGPRYAAAEKYPVRARLPLPPFLFVSRITKIDAEYGKFRPSSIEIEYDFTEDCLLTMGNQVSVYVMTESAQIGIFLVAYMGIDELSGGTLRYRIVNTNCIIHSEIPKVGETFRGVYKIKSFIKNGATTLVTNTYECYVGDRLVLSLDAIGGFFTEHDLESTKGIIDGAKTKGQSKLSASDDSRQRLPVVREKTSFSREELEDFYNGDYHTYVPGIKINSWQEYSTVKPMAPKVDLMDRIVKISDTGGKYGLGELIAEKDIDENHWAFKVHFVNDPVYPGSLLMEGINQLSFFYLLYSGMIMKSKTREVQSIKGRLGKSTFRGQVRPVKSTIRYQISIKEIQNTDDKFIEIFDADVYWKDINVCRIENMSAVVE